MPRHRSGHPNDPFSRLFQAGAQYYASFLFSIGKSALEVLGSVAKRYGRRLAPNQIDQAFDTGLQAWNVGRQFRKAPQERFIGNQNAPQNPGLPSGWRYVVVGEIVDPRGGPSAFRNFVIDSQTRLRKHELEEQAQEQYQGLLVAGVGYRGQTGSPDLPFAQKDYFRISTVVSVERRD